MRGRKGIQERRRRRRQPRRWIGRAAVMWARCFCTCFMAFMMVSRLHFEPLPRSASRQHCLSCLANLRLLVHGRHDQQRPQTCQLRRLLQRHTVRRRGHRLPHRCAQHTLYKRIRVQLGAARREFAGCRAADLDEDQGYGAD